MTTTISRNAPCPCGSGRKYKVCCLRNSEEALVRVGALRALEERLVSRMLGFGLQRFGGLFQPALAFENRISSNDEDFEVFGPWAVYDRDVEGQPLVEWFLQERGDALATPERLWLQDQRDAWLSLWAVEAPDGPHSLRLRDLLTDRLRTVVADRGFVSLPGTVVLGRVVTHGDLSVLASRHPRGMPLQAVSEIADLLRQSIGEGEGPLPPEELRDEDAAAEVLVAWIDLVAEADPDAAAGRRSGVLLCSDRYAATAEPRDDAAIAAAVDSIPGAERTVEDEPGTIGWEFREPGAESESRAFASAELNESGLVVLSDDESGLDRVRDAIEPAAESLLRYDRRHITRRSDLQRRLSGEEDPDDDDEEDVWSPGEAAVFRTHKEAYYAAWPRQRQAFLDGLTPAEAMAVPRLRRHVESILEDMEDREERLPKSVRVDLAGLRRGLGLETERA